MRALLTRGLAHLRDVHRGLVAPGAPDDDDVEPAPPLEASTFGLLVVAAVALVVGFYYGQPWYYRDVLVPGWVADGTLVPSQPWEIEVGALRYHGLALLIIYGVVPLLLAWAVLRVPLRRLGLVPGRQIWRGFALAAGIYVIALPVLYLASGSESLLQTWPRWRLGAVYDDAPGAGFWYAALALQVIGVECLMRGVLVSGLYARLGPASIAVSAMAWAVLEMNGSSALLAVLALVGGFVLGWLTLAARSVWPAIALHWSAAVTLEMMCAHRLGL